MTVQDCLFCKLLAGQVPANVVWKDDTVTAFRDINPQAPVHILLIPNRHIASASALTQADDALAGKLLRKAGELAESEGLAGSGYRVVTNTGRASGQSVDHLHLHLLGGRAMGWPPG